MIWSVDELIQGLHNGRIIKMNVSLPKELEEFVLKEVAQGGYPSAEAVVVEAVRELQNRIDDAGAQIPMAPSPDGNCPPELRSLLLEAVNGPHHPMPSNYFQQLRERLRQSDSNEPGSRVCVVNTHTCHFDRMEFGKPD
jgi:Arc/MetJ-type ribon-helix-helix transcriptional regulator